MKRILLAALLFLGVSAAHAQCTNPQTYSSATITATGSTQLIAAPGLDSNSKTRYMALHICAFSIQISHSSSAVSFGFTTGTGTACATGNTLLTPAFFGIASTVQITQQVYGSTPLVAPSGAALCLNLSGAPTGAVVHIQYSIY